MKKIICLIVTLVFTITISVGTGSNAFAAGISSISASGTTAAATVNGSAEDGCIAVVAVLYDTNETTILRTQSAAVQTDKTYSVNFNNVSLTVGSQYTIKVADYNKGNWTSTKFVAAAVPASTYSVTLNGNGGKAGTNITTYTEGTGATLPTDWTKDGYTFAGWYDNAKLTGSAVTAISKTDTGSKTYYAKWKLNKPDKPAVPGKVKAKATGKHSIKISWTKSTGATSYKVYKATKKAGKYKYAGTVKGTSKTVKKLSANKKYWFKVKAVNKAGTAKSKAVYAKTKR